MAGIPVTIFAQPGEKRAPVVVIAHGFAGSQQLMQAFAVTLARNGYVAVTFDQPGHGLNPAKLLGGLTNDSLTSQVLLTSLDQVVAFAKALPQGTGQVALLGHSMASDIVVRYAETHPDIAGTVAVSLFSKGITAQNPRNLLVVTGALEPAMLRDEAVSVAAMASRWPPAMGTTYGHFADGTARRYSFSPGVEHIGVLFSGTTLRESLAWINAIFGRAAADESGYIDHPGPWFALLYAGILALGWPLSSLLPVISTPPQGANLRWRQLLPVALAPAMLTPLMLWKIPTDFLPILLGDYLTVHFAIYGALTAGSLYLTKSAQRPSLKLAAGGRAIHLAVAALVLATYCIVAIGAPLSSYITNFTPIPSRLPLILAVFAGALPFFLADEWATRGARKAWGGYAFTKFMFAVSLAIAVALNPMRLFFLAIIVPVQLIFFMIFGLFSLWSYRRTGSPWVGAIANAAGFAWAIAITFPETG